MWQALINQGHWTASCGTGARTASVAELLTISAVRDAQGKTRHYVALFSDITEDQGTRESAGAHRALRRADRPAQPRAAGRPLQQAMVQSRAARQCWHVAYLDLDGFKLINDPWPCRGRPVAGWPGLAHEAVLREGDTLARMGGDEFVGVGLTW
jgi:hypothetical protein